MKKKNSTFLILAEFVFCFSFGSLLIYGPLWLTWWSAISNFDHQMVRGVGHMIIIFVIPVLYDLFTKAGYTFLMIGFVFSPIIEVITSRYFHLGSKGNAFDMLCISLISTFFIFLANAAYQKDREIYGPQWNWNFPSNFKR